MDLTGFLTSNWSLLPLGVALVGWLVAAGIEGRESRREEKEFALMVTRVEEAGNRPTDDDVRQATGLAQQAKARADRMEVWKVVSIVAMWLAAVRLGAVLATG